MGLVSKIFGARAAAPTRHTTATASAIADGALDTLGGVIRVLGNNAFALDQETGPERFAELCDAFACHVENGAAVPDFDIPQSADGRREWARVQRFVADRRHAERTFVSERLQDYRGVVDDLVSGLREIGLRDQTTETSIRESLGSIEDAVASGLLPQIKAALSQTVTEVNETFTKQKQQYEEQLQELNQRMSSLRQDLMAAQEEMKRDSLTDAYNRGAFDAAIEQCVKTRFMLQQPVTLIMVDLDNFKQINDTYGHTTGDEVLRAVSDCLSRSFIRKSDIVARYGGDEFAVILPDTPAKQCDALIMRFLEYARAVRVPSAPDMALVACSVGYTEIIDGDTVVALLGRADRGLYKAKAAGRDRATFVAATDAGA